MIVVECDQGTTDWWEAKRGVPSASNYNKILTPTKLKASDQAVAYACQLIAERLYLGPEPWVRDDYESPDMANGKLGEPQARAFYEVYGGAVTEVGFCKTDDSRFGCSPDGLVGDDGGLELKCPKPSTQVRYLHDAVLPRAYMGQVHGALIVTGRKWWDFLSYSPGLPEFLIRVTPDAYTEALKVELEKFWDMYQAMYAKIAARREEVLAEARAANLQESYW